MSITGSTETAREGARRPDGEFGTQNHAEAGVVDAPVIGFAVDGYPARYAAVSYGEPWNGWATPVVTKETLAKLMVDSEQEHRWDGDRLHIDGDDEPMVPNADGLYDTASLGWVFLEENHWGDDDSPDSSCCSCMGGDDCNHPGPCDEDDTSWNGMCASCADQHTLNEERCTECGAAVPEAHSESCSQNGSNA